ncbi:MAG: DUF6531 domain-containing protein [Desulfobacterales bacterium]|nr:DUF6531 domain-containing protein [Desulfobacterales bacterium]
MLSSYAPKQYAPLNVDFGKDPDAKYPVCEKEKVGNPISIYNGNNFESQTDLSFPSPGGQHFEFTRYYNSRSTTLVGSGYGWIHNYRAILNTGIVYNGVSYLRIIDETGRGVYFTDHGGAFKERSHVQLENGNFVWYRLDGRRFMWNSGRYLIRIEEPSGKHRLLTYDAAGRLASVVDEAGGRTLTFNYDGNGRIESISGPTTPAVGNGIWVHYGYDASGNLISVTYADGSGYNYEYVNPGNHNLTAKKDKLGHLLSSWTYDSQDRAVSNFTRDGKGVSIHYVSNNEVRVTDAYGIARTYAIWDIDGRKKVTDISGPSGCADCGDEVTRIEYDNLGRAIEVAYAGGRIDQFDDFDSRGNARIFKKAVGNSDEKTIFYTYHPDIDARLSRTETSLLGSGSKVTIWDYDSDGDETPNENPTRRVYRLIERGFTRDAAGYVVLFDRTTAYTYNSKGQVLTIDGPLPGSQDTIAFSYNAASGDLLAVTRPLTGAVSYSDYDGAGQAGRITDENGNTTLLTYDGRGRITSITREADNAVAEFSYDTAGSLHESIDPDGVSTAFVYDSVYGRLTNAQDPLGNYLFYGYDQQGNIAEQSIHAFDGERLYFRRFSYQGPQHPGKLWKEINPDNTYTEYSYDAGGNIQAVTDPAAKTTFYNHDSLNRLRAVTRPGGVQTVYDYDGNDNLAAVTDAEGHRTVYEQDDPGRLLKTDSPDTNAATYAYDNADNLISKTDARGITVQYTYDALNRLTAIYYPDPDQNVFFSYDQGQNGMGRLTGIRDPSGAVSYGYDFAGRLIRETRTVNGFEHTTLYAHSSAGRIREITYPNNRRVRYRYDAAGQVIEAASIFEEAETVLANEIIHLPFGPITALSFGNGLGLLGSFDQLYRPTTAQTENVYNRSLTYDPGGNIIHIDNLLDPARSQSFGYDPLNRLITAEGIYGSISYIYDNVGNRLSKNLNGTVDIYNYVPGTSRLSDAGGLPYTYDANGNPTAMGTRSLSYNQNNRLIRAADNGSVLGEYVYNALGQRVVKTAVGQQIIYLYDQQGNLMAEADGKGNIVNEYIWLDGRLLAGIKSGKQVVEALVDIDPDTLNLDSHGNWVTAFIQLPEDFDVAEVDPATLTLNGTVYADRVQVEDFDSDGIPNLMAKFDRARVSGTLQPGDGVEMLVEGEADAFLISGVDTIRVISKGKKNRKGQDTATAARTAFSISTASKTSRLVFYHLDHLGTPQVVTDENAEVVWQADYLPFGEVNITANVVGNEFRFPGQYYDHETGLYYNYHRYYNPATGRYLTPDPVGLGGGANLFVYVKNNSINFTDFAGLFCECNDACPSGSYVFTGTEYGGFLFFGGVTAKHLLFKCMAGEDMFHLTIQSQCR